MGSRRLGFGHVATRNSKLDPKVRALVDAYLWLKLLHIVSVIVFLGNIAFGLFWVRRARKLNDMTSLGQTFASVIVSDRRFTMPSVAAIVLTGIATAEIGELPIFGTGWILWPLLLFMVSGIAFMLWVAPLQRRILAAAQKAPKGKDFTTVDALIRRWEVWGLVALLTPVAALVIMVLKPNLPGF
jgi:uncharacterized membrane protein